MGTCLSKKTGSCTTTPSLAETKSTTRTTSVEFEWKNSSQNGIIVSKPEVKTQPEVKNNKKVQLEKHVDSVQEHKGQVKKEIFIIKHRKSHDDRDKDSSIESAELMGMRTSSCTKEDVDAILIHCGRLSRNSSGKPSSFRRRFSSSKTSIDFDNCDNDTIEDDWKESAEKLHLESPRSVSMDRNRRRTPSREREQQQCSSSRERRVSRSPVRRSSDIATAFNSRNNTNTSSVPAKMVSVPATVSSLVMDKSNNNGCGESAVAITGIKRITVRRNVGSPRSQSPARANGNSNAANPQLELSFSRNSSRKKEESPYRRNPLSELESNSLAIPHSTTNYNSSRVQNRSKKKAETESNQKPNASRIPLDKCVDVNCKTKLQQDEHVQVTSSTTDNVVVKTVVPPVIDNLKPQTLTRTRSSRRSRDLELDLNPEDLLVPPQSYTSLLLEDIQNFHQKSTPPAPPVSLPACVARACSILEAVANLNSNTSSNLSGVVERRNSPGFQSSRNEYNVPLDTSNSYVKSVADTKDSIVESELIVYDDMVESSLHKFETMDKGGSNMEEQESSGSNNLTASSAKLRCGISSSWEPSSTDSKDCWTVRTNNSIKEGQKSPLGFEGKVSSVARRANVDGAKKKLNSKRRESDRQHDNETGRGRLGANNVLHMKPVVTAAAST